MDLEEVVDPFEGSVGGSSVGVVGEYFLAPGDDLVYYVVVLGDGA